MSVAIFETVPSPTLAIHMEDACGSGGQLGVPVLLVLLSLADPQVVAPEPLVVDPSVLSELLLLDPLVEVPVESSLDPTSLVSARQPKSANPAATARHPTASS